MTGAGRRIGLLVVCAMLIALVSCRAVEDGERVAELIDQKAPVTRDFKKQVGQWRPVKKGDLFYIGDGIKTGKSASAKLKIVPEGEMLVQSDTLVRFQATAPGEEIRRVQVQTGSIEIDSARAPLQIRTEIGLARIERGSRLQLKASPHTSELKVLVGSVELDQQGKKVAVSAGQGLSVDVGGVTIDREEPKSVAAIDASPREPASPIPDASHPPDAQADKPLAVGTGGGDRADFTLAALESATIHDPDPPTRVRVPSPDAARAQRWKWARRRAAPTDMRRYGAAAARSYACRRAPIATEFAAIARVKRAARPWPKGPCRWSATRRSASSPNGPRRFLSTRTAEATPFAIRICCRSSRLAGPKRQFQRCIR